MVTHWLYIYEMILSNGDLTDEDQSKSFFMNLVEATHAEESEA